MDATGGSTLLITAFVLSSLLAWWLKSPDLSAILLTVIARSPQILDPILRLDPTGFIRGQVDLLQTLTSQFLAKGDWVTGELQPRPIPFLLRVRCILAVASTDISVIVPTLNEEEYLPRCLKSLMKQTYDGQFEILVVDGGSKDRTVEIARNYADGVMTVPRAPVGAARNLGARKASGDILAFIDADTVANPHWLCSIDESFRREPETVGLTGPTLPYDGRLSDLITYRLWTIYFQRVLLHLQMPHVIGFNCAYRRTPFLSVGGFDEDSVMSEDIKLAHKIRRYGRITFERQMSALTSARRFRAYGHVYIGGLYIMNGFTTLLFDRSHSNYPPVR